MQYPQNLETAVTIENIVRENGSIPATIAILNGKINVGKFFINNKILYISSDN